MQFRSFLQVLSLGTAALAFSACGPTYPKCENDEHCAEKGEFCLNGSCQQCRDNSHCSGAGMVCSAGACERRVGYCDPEVACPGNQKCRDNECGAECLGNNECQGGTFCSNGSCIEKPQCGEGADTFNCSAGQECVGGRCQSQLAQCRGDVVYFDFNKAAIKSNQRKKLSSVAQCLKGDNPAPVNIGGHCDERGTEEYNLALGERRAEAARRYLESLGVKSSLLSTTSYGESQLSAPGQHSKNRRVEFVPQ